jgi:hypothetical protein
MIAPKKKGYKYCKYIFYFILSQAILLYLFAHLSYFSSLLDQTNHEESENLRAHADRLKLDVKENSDKLKTLKLEQDFIKDLGTSIQKSNRTSIKESNDVISKELFKNHPILGLNDEELENTPISVMMGWYENLGTEAGMRTCSEDFGNVLVQRWRNEKKSYCSSKNEKNANDNSVIDSSIDCYLVHQTRLVSY